MHHCRGGGSQAFAQELGNIHGCVVHGLPFRLIVGGCPGTVPLALASQTLPTWVPDNKAAIPLPLFHTCSPVEENLESIGTYPWREGSSDRGFLYGHVLVFPYWHFPLLYFLLLPRYPFRL